MSELSRSMSALLEYLQREWERRRKHGRSRRRPPCKWLGSEIPEVFEACDGCRGKIRLRVMDCKETSGMVPQSCTLADCTECFFYEPKDG